MHRTQQGAIALEIILLLVQREGLSNNQIVDLLMDLQVYAPDIQSFLARIKEERICRNERRYQELALQIVVRMIELEWYQYHLFGLVAERTMSKYRADRFVESLSHLVGKRKQARDTMLEL